MIPPKGSLLLSLVTIPFTLSSPIDSKPAPSQSTCTKTKVAILGAGVAGITAAQALHNASISDFLIIDVNDYIGGRVAHTKFGKDPSTGLPYTIELGANWVQGLGTPGGPENPIWTLAKKWGLKNTYSDYDFIQYYDENGEADYGTLLEDFDKAYAGFEQDAGEILTSNLQDRTARAGLSIRDWKPKKDMKAQAIEYFNFDYEYIYPPDQSSQSWIAVAYNATFYQYSDENNFVHDPRGFNYILNSEASTFLAPNDPRLLLSTNITHIDYTSTNSVTIHTSNGSCIEASYAICTFSLGVLQNEIVEFTPKFPDWKKEAVESMQMGTFTKIFLQFPPSDPNGTFFWEVPSSKTYSNSLSFTNSSSSKLQTQFFVYADPEERGYYPVWQSLTPEEFYPGSGIIFVTVVASRSYIVEAQSDEVTKREVLKVLRDMYGEDKVPEPLDFLYPRWSLEPWAMGSFTNWPPGLSIETHQNLRANLNRLWFAGEALSVEYFGYLQGAYSEGLITAKAIACLLSKNPKNCKQPKRHETVRGCTSDPLMLSESNGWFSKSWSVLGFGGYSRWIKFWVFA